MFHPRIVRSRGSPSPDPLRLTGASRWSWELIRRTSAPARLAALEVRPDEPDFLDEPFVVWFGSSAIEPLSSAERRGLQRFLSLGGVLFVDDSRPEQGEFASSVEKELERLFPQDPLQRVPEDHVLYKSYYLLDGPSGRVEAAGDRLRGMRLGGTQVAVPLYAVIVSRLDLLGALAQDAGGRWALPMPGNGTRGRELAVRFAVNLGMYVLCLDYKDDQVHAEEVMRRRGRR